MNPHDETYALKSEQLRQERLAMLDKDHTAPLVRYRARLLENHCERSVPHFDPCDGGIFARALFLLEAPGPKAMHSSFISRNNPDPTARNMNQLLSEAGIARGDTRLWNIVLWYVGDGTRIRSVNSADPREAMAAFDELLALLPSLEMIVLVRKERCLYAGFDCAKKSGENSHNAASQRPVVQSLSRTQGRSACPLA